MFNDSAINNNISGKAKIKVIGVGGAGNNAINRMIEARMSCAEYVVVNTDSQILALSPCENKIQIGTQLTKGLGAGADPDVGRAAAEESKDILTEIIKGTDLLFITAGMGGGTGTGAAPVIAKIARDLKILTVAVVTEPFAFEGKKRMENTVKGLDNLKKYVDTLIVIPNDKIRTVVDKNTTMVEALRVADEILKQGIKGLAELIVNPALINLDFADVKTILKDRGIAHLGVGVAKGDNRIIEAVRVAVNCPLLETTIEGAQGVILNVVGGNDLTFAEVADAAELVRSVVDASANIIFGARIDPNVQDEVEIVGLTEEIRKVVVTGVEMFRKLLDQAEAGDNIGVLLRGVQRNEIERGQVLAKPGSITPHHKFKAQVYVLSKEEGGRHTPFFNNYRPQFYFRTTDVTGIISLPEGTEMCMPGDNVEMTIELITKVAMAPGLRFAIREGGRTVGAGSVTEIIE